MRRDSRQRSDLEPLVARLVEAQSSHERDRALLHAAVTLAECTAGAVYGLGRSGWRTRLCSPASDALPRTERVEAVLQGALSPDVLPPGELVLRHDELPWALALGGVRAPRARDLLEALLVLRSVLGQDSDSPGDELAPIPHREPPR